MQATVNHIKTILLIDDDEDDCLLLSQALAAVSNNVALKCTQSTDHLLETIGRNQPSLIIIDLYMPKKHGLDLLRQIKNHPEYNDIPVVMWSTSSPSKNIMAETQGVQHFFQKPHCYKELKRGLKSILLQNGIEIQ
jgi:DNA-binding NtrC family response regulator